MFRVRLILAVLLALSGRVLSFAAEPKLMPAEVFLTGPRATQRLLVVAEEKGQVVGDWTDGSHFTSADPRVAAVDEAGFVTAMRDGETTITAVRGGQKASVQVRVQKAREQSPPSFRNDVIPALTRLGCNSGACHGALAGKGGLKLSLRGYDPDADHHVLTRQAQGRRMDCLEPARSLLIQKPTAALQHGGGKKLDPGSLDYQLILEWIAAAAPGPRTDDPHPRRLEVFPAAAVLKPEEAMTIVVRAWYSDGRAADVTRWCKFTSTEELVANVDDGGKVTVKGHGEAAISVWFSNLVAVARITSPYPYAAGKMDHVTSPGPGSRPVGFSTEIDRLIDKKLAALRIPASPICTDAEFIRRAYLDAAGILPLPEDVEKFVAEKAGDKRSRLIDQLLERQEFADYWAYKWSDLLLISTRKLPQPAMWSFYRFVRQSVADNKPWDRFAREILLATGGNLQNGEANYFVLHKDVSDLTEATAITFLGMSITCCRCHNHPLEKWTQDQYWSFANLFSRVSFKNGDRPGEVLVQSQPAGDIPHLRKGIPMPPAPLDGQPLGLGDPRDRRRYFADWLTAPDNPYFARSLVNRVWRNFMGRGLVEPEDDLRQTNPSTNEELFDALARDFVASGYDVKRLIRNIMNSAAYQRSSRPLPENMADDRFYSHYLIRRLPAEVVLDAYSQVTGSPTPFDQVYSGVEGGTAPTNAFPTGTRALQLPDSRVASRFLDSFGRPNREQTCSCERQQDSTISQALHLNNGQTLNDKLRDKNGRIEQWLTQNLADEEAVRRLFLLALCRQPTPTEARKFQTLMAEAAADNGVSRREALEDLFWAILTGREFLFNH